MRLWEAVAKNDFDAEVCNIIVKEHPELKELLESSLLRGTALFDKAEGFGP